MNTRTCETGALNSSHDARECIEEIRSDAIALLSFAGETKGVDGEFIEQLAVNMLRQTHALSSEVHQLADMARRAPAPQPLAERVDRTGSLKRRSRKGRRGR